MFRVTAVYLFPTNERACLWPTLKTTNKPGRKTNTVLKIWRKTNTVRKHETQQHAGRLCKICKSIDERWEFVEPNALAQHCDMIRTTRQKKGGRKAGKEQERIKRGFAAVLSRIRIADCCINITLLIIFCFSGYPGSDQKHRPEQQRREGIDDASTKF